MSDKAKIHRAVARINRERQLGLFGQPADDQIAPELSKNQPPARFIEPDPNDILIGNQSLRSHLEQMKLTDALVVRELLGGLDYSEFEQAYQGGGRRAYSPKSMTGLVLFGLLRGISSLRELERFSRVDVECWWVSGGISPDHSVIGRFINRHVEQLSEGLFEKLVVEVLKRTSSGRGSLAGDGTVIEAACSRYGILKREAAQAKRDGLGDSAQARTEAAQLDTMLEVLDQRRAAGGGRGHEQLNPAEPQASVLKQKNGRGSRPSYVPVVLANDQRVVVDAQVDGSQERRPLSAAIQRQLDRDGTFKELLLDAGFRSTPMMEQAIEHDLNLLMPASGGEKGSPTKAAKYFPMNQFRYDLVSDVYHCPGGHQLTRTGGRDPARSRYRTKACGQCPLRDQCTPSARGRSIERTRASELREALSQVMAQPAAAKRYGQRQAMVEPVFSVLRGRQGLNRFRRRGLAGVRLEFRLHIMAYNLSRAIARYFAHHYRSLRAQAAALSDDLMRRLARWCCLHLNWIGNKRLTQGA